MIGPTAPHVDNKRNHRSAVERRNEVHWLQERKTPTLWVLIWEEVTRSHQDGILPEAEPVKAHRPEKKNQELPKGRMGWQEVEQCWMVGEVAQMRTSTVQQRREGGFRRCSKDKKRSDILWTNSWKLRNMPRSGVWPQADIVA